MKKAALISAFIITVFEAYQGFFHKLLQVLHSSDSVAYKAGFTTAQTLLLATAIILGIIIYQTFKSGQNIESVIQSEQLQHSH